MTIQVTIEITRDFDVSADFEATFALLSDVPKSASHFPKVDKLIDMGNNTYRWEMERLGVDKHAIQTIYAAHYVSDKEAGKVTWNRVENVGNGLVDGNWVITPAGARTHLRFCTQGVLTLPLPGFLKLAVSPVVKHEFNALVDRYVSNLQRALA